ncbi:MAG: glycosyltransferase family 2 protein [Candidatus Bathyarchaeia archaeon]
MWNFTLLQLTSSVALALITSILCIFGINNHVLMCLHAKAYRRAAIYKKPSIPEEWPFVTIQVATYNEGYIVTRLLESCLKVDYPADKFEIIVIDDSTDETISILREYEKRYYPKIKVIHRDTRAGYKAGALNEALKNSRGEFILVLDADSILEPDFLKKTIPIFLANEKIGFIQGKLKCLNERESWLTRTLALVNDWFANFLQSSFSKCGMVMGFVGHGGIFRRKALEDVGGWMSDTIAEDLDIAYRLQLRGWKALYVEEAISFEEAPPSYYSAIIRFKRHIKGSLQNLAKHWWSIVKHKGLSPFKKVEAIMQLAYPLVYPLGLICLALTLITYAIIPGAIIDKFWLSVAGFICSAVMLISLPCIALIISPVPSLLIILLTLAFSLVLFSRIREIIRGITWIDLKVIFGLLLVWCDNMLNCLSLIAGILRGKGEEWIPTERILRRNISLKRGKKMAEASLRIIASITVILSFIIIGTKNLSLNSFGALLPIVLWLYSAYIIMKDNVKVSLKRD